MLPSLPAMRLSTAYLAVLSVLPLSSLAVPNPYVVHEKRDVSPEWIRRGRIAPDAKFPVRIGLVQSNLDQGHNLLMDISSPTSPNFASHLSESAVHELFAPSEETVRETRKWLTASGIAPDRVTHTANKGWLAFMASAKELEGLLQTKYHVYAHREDGSAAVACDEYKVPTHMARHVDFVTPGVKLSRSTRKQRAPPSKTLGKRELPTDTYTPEEVRAFNTSTCGKVMTPACIQALYQVPEATEAQPGNEMGIINGNSTYIQSDMDLFFANAYPKIPPGTHAHDVLLNGAIPDLVAPNSSDQKYIGILEANLDHQMAWPLVYPQNITLFDTGFFLDDFLEVPWFPDPYDPTNATQIIQGQAAVAVTVIETALEAVDGSYCEVTRANRSRVECGTHKRTNVLSISIPNSEFSWPERQQQRLCTEFMKLGLQGTSVLVASGDMGVADRTGPGVEYCPGPDHNLFDPSGFAACPYVTAVGGTTLQTAADGTFLQEVAMLETKDNGTAALVQVASGGGFSNRVARPEWQAAAVDGYLRAHPPPFAGYDAGAQAVGGGGGVYNRAGRAFPDVAAAGNHVLQAMHGEFIPQAGTSASAPIVAGIVTRINEERIKAGKKPVGFLNPSLYAHPEALNDVVDGDNRGCGTQGFLAVEGWDPVTGLGTPNYPKLLDVFMKLP